MTRKLRAIGFFLPMLIQGQRVAVPNSGFIFDADSQAIRRIDGIAGSATLGSAVAGADNVTAAGICSSRSFALIANGDSSTSSVLKLDTLASLSLPAATLSAPDQIVLSASCSIGLLFSAETSRLQLVTGLPNAPVLAADFTVSIGPISSLAVSDNGTTILAVSPAIAVYVLTPVTAPQIALAVHGDADITFINSSDVLIADSASNQILKIAGILKSPDVQVLAAAEQGISSPTSIAFDLANGTALVGNSGTSEIGMLRLADNTLNFLGCGCVGLFSSLGGEIYEVAAPRNEFPLLLLDAKSSPAKVLFVPSRQ